MKVDCPGLADANSFIKDEYSYNFSNYSPEIVWDDAPSSAKSFAVYVHDPDAPVGNWIHWIVINIPASVKKLEKNQKITPPVTEVENDFRIKRYGGPCPPSGTHKYYFTVYALDVEKLGNVDRKNFLSEIKKHELANASFMAKYSKK